MGIHTGPASAHGHRNHQTNLTSSGEFTYGTWSVGDGILFLLILIGWVAALCLFLHKWGDVRIPLPRDLIRRFRPMNVDNVRIVKQENKSIIYKSYGKRMSVTMEERDKRLEELRAQQDELTEPEEPAVGLSGRWRRFRRNWRLRSSEADIEKGHQKSLLVVKKEKSKRRLSALQELGCEEREDVQKSEEKKKKTKTSSPKYREIPGCPKHTQTDDRPLRPRCITPEIRVESFELL